MGEINRFRAHCPICGTQMRAGKVVSHLTSKHPTVKVEDIEAISDFIILCENICQEENARLELNIKDLTFKQLARRTILNQEIIPPRVGNSKFIECTSCGRLVLREIMEYHIAHMHKPNRSEELPKYSHAWPHSGRPVQGGAPGLGKRS